MSQEKSYSYTLIQNLHNLKKKNRKENKKESSVSISSTNNFH